jgi:hypothetical protein
MNKTKEIRICMLKVRLKCILVSEKEGIYRIMCILSYPRQIFLLRNINKSTERKKFMKTDYVTV